ncbi:putative Glucose-methanol-choline oxidoreductase N-terminal domain-containing protein [Seiridium unicorne]|uniref:Glucose-methanol-choline oxidoreductase N-terminal domain-containing protein n=1 Tax=Seiridium unicorne TaxID=138068 RepID=A0ABR2VJR2_9PEZI
MRLSTPPLSLASSTLLLSTLPATSGLYIPILSELGSALGDLGISVTNPILSAVQSVLNGDGLVEGALGAVEGALGVEATYDYVVVGGGTAGNAIGYRLAEAGYSVAIVEAGLNYEIAKPVLGTTPGGDIIGIGSSILDSVPTVDWEFVTEPQAGANDREVHYARGKCLGGSSALNFMIHHRGSAGSYDMWADEVGDDSYKYVPVTHAYTLHTYYGTANNGCSRFDSFLPYFQKSVNFTPPDTTKRRANASTQYDPNAFSTPGGPVQVGYTNWVSDWATWLEKGMEAIGMNRTTGFSSGDLMGYHYSQATIRASDQTRSSSAQYIYTAVDEGLDNLKVYTQTLATKVVLDSNNTATGVEVNSLGVGYTIHASKEVVVSAGAFQSPQLLMVSGIGPKATLEEFDIPVIVDAPGVGQNMWDHIMFGPAYEVNFDTLDRVLHDPVVLAETLVDYVADGTGALSSNVVEFLGWEKLPDKYRETWSTETQEALAQFPDDWPEVEHISGNGYIGNFRFPALQQPLDGKQYATILGAMAAPVSRGNVTIKSSSTFDLPLVSPNWLTAKADQEVAISWYRRMREVWNTDVIQEIVIGEEYWPGVDQDTDEEILAVIQDSLMTVWHAAGTCKMGKESDEAAVIDNEAKVFGVQGLRVVDASSFPILPPGHPQSTIYALAEKIADAIINA